MDEALDVETAFLQGLPLKRAVFVRPPADCTQRYAWKLKKCVYGIPGASRQWYDRIHAELVSLGGKRSHTDYALFIWPDGCIIIHVDDLWTIGNASFFESVGDRLSTIFVIGQSKNLPHCYLGVDVEKNEIGVEISQENCYQSKLQEIPVSATGAVSSKTKFYRR